MSEIVPPIKDLLENPNINENILNHFAKMISLADEIAFVKKNTQEKSI